MAYHAEITRPSKTAAFNVAQSIGRSSPLGTTVADGGVNFSLFSRSATGVELLLFDRADDARPARVIRVDHTTNRTYPKEVGVN